MKNIRLWNVIGELKLQFPNHSHTDCITKLKYFTFLDLNYTATVGKDGKLVIWRELARHHKTINAHDNEIYTLAVNYSKTKTYLATGGKDKQLKIWDFEALDKPMRKYSLDSEIFALEFNTEFGWLAAALNGCVAIFDINNERGPIGIVMLDLLPSADQHTK